jgi:hypothetical protein
MGPEWHRAGSDLLLFNDAHKMVSRVLIFGRSYSS